MFICTKLLNKWSYKVPVDQVLKQIYQALKPELPGFSSLIRLEVVYTITWIRPLLFSWLLVDQTYILKGYVGSVGSASATVSAPTLQTMPWNRLKRPCPWRGRRWVRPDGRALPFPRESRRACNEYESRAGNYLRHDVSGRSDTRSFMDLNSDTP